MMGDTDAKKNIDISDTGITALVLILRISIGL